MEGVVLTLCPLLVHHIISALANLYSCFLLFRNLFVSIPFSLYSNKYVCTKFHCNWLLCELPLTIFRGG